MLKLRIATVVRASALAAVLTLTAGCASFLGPAGMALDAITGGISIYQRYQDRMVQQDQTEAIKAVTEAVRNLDMELQMSRHELVKMREAMEAREPGSSRGGGGDRVAP